MRTFAEAVGGKKRVIGGPFGSKLTTRDYCKDGMPVIRGSNMEVDGRWIGGEYVYVTPEKVRKDLSTNVAKPGDIIVTQRGTLGQVSIIPDNSRFPLAVISQSQMAVSVDTREASRDFVYYFLRSPQFSEYAVAQTIQTGVPHINLGILRDAPGNFPALPIQKEIAAVLGALDDKIELNRRMAGTLEEMARALYRSWFVDFDPVRVKAEGREPAHMDAATAALFPDRFGEDGLPEGWEETSIGDVAEIVGGSTPSTKNEEFWSEGQHSWATPKDLSDLQTPFLLATSRLISDAGLRTISSGLSPAGSLLMSSRAPVGYLALATAPVAVNQGFIVIRETDKISGYEALCWCYASMGAIVANANGSTFQEISKKNFRPLRYVLANSAVRRAFLDAVGPLFERLKAGCEENQTLAELRDTLLPKLMSGEIRVGEARKMAEAAE